MDWRTLLAVFEVFAAEMRAAPVQRKEEVVAHYREFGLNVEDRKQLYVLLRGAHLVLRALRTGFQGRLTDSESVADFAVSKRLCELACGRLLRELQAMLPADVSSGHTRYEELFRGNSWPVASLNWTRVREMVSRLDEGMSAESRQVGAELEAAGRQRGNPDGGLALELRLFQEFCYWAVLCRLQTLTAHAVFQAGRLQQLGPLSTRFQGVLVVGRAQWPA